MRLNHELARLGIHPEPIGVSLFAVTCIGIAIAILGNVQPWSTWLYCQQEKISFVEYTSCNTLVLRGKEIPPKGYKFLKGDSANTQIKAAGIILSLSGGFLSLFLNGQIAETLLKAEEEEYAISQRETIIKDKEANLEDLVEERALKLHYAYKAKEFEALYQQDSVPSPKSESSQSSEFSDDPGEMNSDKLLAWLIQKSILESSVSKLSSSSIYGKHHPVEDLRGWLDELVAFGGVQWLSEDKTQFKLLMEF